MDKFKMGNLIQQIKIRVLKLRNNFRIHHATGLCMIFTGIFYPLFPNNGVIPKILIIVLTPNGFILGSILMTLGGIGLLWKPKWIVLWLIPLFIFMGHLGFLALLDITYTAVLYYSSLPILTLYFYAKEYHSNFNFILINRVNALQMTGVLHIFMAIVLIRLPHGAGMDLLYQGLNPFLLGLIEPSLFYQLLYLCTGIILLSPAPLDKRVTQALTSPLLVHGLSFLIITLTNQVWAFSPFYILGSYLWIRVGGQDGGI